MTPEAAYLVFGATLCAALAALAVFYFRRGRKGRVEAPKYRMLEDDDDPR
jgi:cbb3-type cytochrome oxidase subunit 3